MTLPKNFSRQGVVPLFLLILIGVVVVVGGGLVVRQQFLKEGKTGKTTYNEAKIKEQIENPQELPEIKEEPKGELSTGNYVYKPKPASGGTATLPAFSITPPSGWEKFSPGGVTQVQFKSPTADRVDQEDGLYAEAKPQISVSIQSAQGQSLDQILAQVRKTITPPFEEMDIVSDQKVTYAGNDAQLFEVELKAKGVAIRTIDYYFIADGFLVHTGGTALKEFWSTHNSVIKASLATFKLL